MSDENDHVDVVLEDAKPKDEKEPEVIVEVAPEKTSEPESKPQVISAEDGIQEMKRRLDNERRAREEAEMRAYQAAQQAQKANSEVKDTNYQIGGAHV